MRMAADVDPPPIPVHQPGRVQGLRITAASRSQVWCRHAPLCAPSRPRGTRLVPADALVFHIAAGATPVAAASAGRLAPLTRGSRAARSGGLGVGRAGWGGTRLLYRHAVPGFVRSLERHRGDPRRPRLLRHTCDEPTADDPVCDEPGRRALRLRRARAQYQRARLRAALTRGGRPAPSVRPRRVPSAALPGTEPPRRCVHRRRGRGRDRHRALGSSRRGRCGPDRAVPPPPRRPPGNRVCVPRRRAEDNPRAPRRFYYKVQTVASGTASDVTLCAPRSPPALARACAPCLPRRTAPGPNG